MQIQKAIEQGRLQLTGQQAMKVEGHLFPVNMASIQFSKEEKGKAPVEEESRTMLLTSTRARAQNTIDPSHQITTDELKERIGARKHTFKVNGVPKEGRWFKAGQGLGRSRPRARIMAAQLIQKYTQIHNRIRRHNGPEPDREQIHYEHRPRSDRYQADRYHVDLEREDHGPREQEHCQH